MNPDSFCSRRGFLQSTGAAALAGVASPRVKNDPTEKEDRVADKSEVVAAFRKKLDVQAKIDPLR
jgi:hypothetical protein